MISSMYSSSAADELNIIEDDSVCKLFLWLLWINEIYIGLGKYLYKIRLAIHNLFALPTMCSHGRRFTAVYKGQIWMTPCSEALVQT